MTRFEHDGPDPTELTLTEHLTELRRRLIFSLIAVLLTTGGALSVAPALLDYSIEPLVSVLQEKNQVETAVFYTAEKPESFLFSLEREEQVHLRVETHNFQTLLDEAEHAAQKKRPFDLIWVHTSSSPYTLNLDALDALEPAPLWVLLHPEPSVSEVLDLSFEGVPVLKHPPKPAAVSRTIRRAAALAGKAQKDGKLVVLSPLDPFFAYLKVALVIGLFLACPIWLYQAWLFIAPGLYRKEKKVVLPVVVGGSVLFVGGGAFAYFFMFPIMFDVLINQMMPESLAGSFTVDKYLGLLLRVTVAFGVVFELPLVLALLSAVGLVNSKMLIGFRGYAVVLAFVLGAVLTPADPITQIGMAVPLVIFYEIGIFFAKRFEKKRAKIVADEGATPRQP